MAEENGALGVVQVAIRATLDKLGDDLDGAKKQIDKSLSGGIQQIGAKLGKLGSAAVLGGIAVVTAAVVGIGAAAFDAAMTMDEAFDTIRIQTGATGDELAALQDDVKAVFTSVPTDATTAAEALSVFNQRLGLTGEPLQALTEQMLELSRMTGGDATTSAELFTRVLGDWSVPTEDASDALDKLYAASQATGIGVDALASKVVQFGSPLRLMGFSLEDSIALFSKWEKEGVNSELVMGSLRIAAGKFADEGRPLRESLLSTFDSIQNNEDATAALAEAMEVFGARAGPDMAAAIREGRFSIEDITAAISDSEGAILDASAATMDWPEKWQLVKNKATTALAPIGSALMDVAGKLIDRLMPAVEKLATWFEEKVAPAIGPVADAVVQLGDAFGWLIKGDAGSFAELLADSLYGIADALGLDREVVGPFIDGFTNLAYTVGNFLTTQLIPFVQEHSEAFKAALIAIGAVLAGAAIAAGIASIGAAIGALLNPVTLIIAAVALLAAAWTEDWGGIRTFLTDLWTSTLQPIFSVIVEWLQTNIPIAVQWLADAWNNVLKPALEAIWDVLSTYVIPVLQVLAEVYIALVIAYFRLLWEGLQTLWEWLKIAADAISTVLGPALEWLKTNLLDPLIEAFKKIGEKISDVVGFFKKLKDGIANVKLPDWLTPGSPTPFQLGLEGIGEAMGELTQLRLPSLGAELNAMGTPALAEGGVSNSTNTRTTTIGQIVIPNANGREVVDELKRRGYL